MNNKFKKGALALGTIATIAAPVAAVISCGVVNDLKYDGDANYNKAQTWDQFISGLDGMGLKDKTILNKGEYQASFVLYEKEVELSKKTQTDTFNYDVFKKNTEIADLTAKNVDLKAEHDKTGAGAPTDSQKTHLQDQMDANDKKITDLTKEVDEINKKVDHIKNDTIPYDSSSFASDYPKLLQKLENIKKLKVKYVADAKDAFIDPFGTTSEGQSKWPAERSSKYNGANSDEEAAEYLTNQVISDKAFSRFKFEINSSFTLEQYVYAEKIDTTSFSFLTNTVSKLHYNSKYDTKLKAIEGIIDGKTTPEEKQQALYDYTVANPTTMSSKVYFLASTSEEKVWYDDAKLTSLLKNKVIDVKHALITAKRGTDKNDPWDVKQADVLKLLSTYGSAKINGIEALEDPKLFTDDYFTSTVLSNFVTADGSITNGGSLGYKTILGYVKAMVPGFALGVLQQAEDSTKVIDGKTTVYDVFKTKMEDARDVALTDIGRKTEFEATTTDIAEKNEIIKQALTHMGDDKIKSVFGSIFRDTFGDMNQLIMKLGANFFVVSQFGIHVIHVSSAATDITSEVDGDLKSMADGDSSTSKTGVASLLNDSFSSIEILEYMADTTNGLDTDLKKALEDANPDDKDIYSDFTALVKQTGDSAKNQKIQEALGTKISTWYVGELNKQILDGKTLAPSDIYKYATSAGGK